MRELWNIYVHGLRNSYSSLVFSRDSWVGKALFVVTMFYPLSGVCGLFCALLVNGLALTFSLDRFKLTNGIYGFNAVILGLALGALFPPNLSLLYMLLASSFLLLLLMAGVEALFAKKQLPYLVFPFLFCLWFLLLLTQQKDGEFYIDCVLGDHFGMLGWGDYTLSVISDHPMWLALPNVVTEYFVSLSSVLFRQDIFLGCVLAVMLFCHSRIAFLFTLVNHLFAYLLYHTIGCELFHIPYVCFGFNFILTALALSCYLVPSKSALLCSLLLIPVQFVAAFAMTRLLAYFYLPSFSSAFCVVTLLFLILLKHRTSNRAPYFSYFLERTPEENLYYNQTNAKRFQWYNYHPFSLPFYGEWRVSQGVDGAYTHQGVWKEALDFVVEVDGKQFQGNGASVKDYYCYGKPVLAPGDGVVVWVENSVEDNPIGESNKMQNWGNYVVLKHWEGFYSLMAHLKKDSFVCAVGQSVKKGDELALCGNSGLSPYPHLHFQFQGAPYAGAPTIDYPFVNYIRENELVPCAVPQEGETLRNLCGSDWEQPYQFYVGQVVTSHCEAYGEAQWQVCEAYGYRYLYDERRGSKAWFALHDGIFEFQRYEGSKDCALYHFFLANQKVITKDVECWCLKEEIPLSVCHVGWRKFFVDLVSPFFPMMHGHYEATKNNGSSEVEAVVVATIMGRKVNEMRYRTTRVETNALEVRNMDGFVVRIEL